jgi:hypothetical protein
LPFAQACSARGPAGARVPSFVEASGEYACVRSVEEIAVAVAVVVVERHGFREYDTHHLCLCSHTPTLHIISYHIISYHIMSWHVMYHVTLLDFLVFIHRLLLKLQSTIAFVATPNSARVSISSCEPVLCQLANSPFPLISPLRPIAEVPSSDNLPRIAIFLEYSFSSSDPNSLTLH